MRATFPAGTVSGAPKIRAMQIIADLEGTTRGPYGGRVGYFSFNGNLDTCITSAPRCVSQRPSPGLRPPSPAPAGEGQRASRRRLGERLRTGSGISGNGEQVESHAQSRGLGGDVWQ